jgi:hypothetical protein
MMQIEDLEEILNNRIIEAYSAGFSVVEITKALRKTSVDFVHSLLRETGHIPAMVRSEYRRQYEIDPRLTAAIRKKGFSFGRWCLGWKMDPSSATAELKTTPGHGIATTAHIALQRDFPEVFFSMFGGKRIKQGKRKRASTQPASLRIDWDVERKAFFATVPEYPMIEGRGKDWDETFYAIKSAFRMQEYIMRLNRLDPHSLNDGMAH